VIDLGQGKREKRERVSEKVKKGCVLMAARKDKERSQERMLT
jgi:hypothetical protein